METVVLPLLRGCSFLREPVYRRYLAMKYTGFQTSCHNISFHHFVLYILATKSLIREPIKYSRRHILEDGGPLTLLPISNLICSSPLLLRLGRLRKEAIEAPFRNISLPSVKRMGVESSVRRRS
jgi:hypothetical protein